MDPAAATFVTTEHFALQGARAATISETNGRAGIFLSSVSAGLVAIAFAGQTSRTALYTFGLVLFPVLSFLGSVTFRRTLQTSIDDTIYLQRINRLRHFYIDTEPALAKYIGRPAPDGDVAAILRSEGYQGGNWQTMLSVPGTVGVLTSVLLGVTVGFAVGAISGDNLWAATLCGVVVFGVAAVLHHRFERLARPRAHAAFAEEMFPDGS
jgi:hypothetical protein